MTTQLQPRQLLVFLLIFAILLSACSPVQPMTGQRAPAASEDYASSESTSDETYGDYNGYEAPAAAPADESADVVSESHVAAAPAGERAGDSSGSAYPAPPRHDRADQYEAVTAGVTDDNVEWQAYLDYLNRNRRVNANKRDVSERYIITVVDGAGRTVHDATVEIYVDDYPIFSGRTDAGGQVLFHPLALEVSWQLNRSSEYRVVATKGYIARSETFQRYRNDRWSITIGEPEQAFRTQLDLLFLVDATGSMDDEIDKLKATMADIADEITILPEAPDVRYGLVAYRDRGDAFVVRSYDFTPDLRTFQRTLAALRADGGGDYPEALNEALHRSIHDLSWREDDTVRLTILVADAPPHLDYRWEEFSYDADMFNAVARGIKIFPVGASNLDAAGEYIFRQLAQFTGGKFVFLTYRDGSNPHSGPGTETDHDVDTYSVDTLDRLVVRLVRDELAKLAQMADDTLVSGSGQTGQHPVSMPTPPPLLRPVSCTIEGSWNDCMDNPETAQVITKGRGAVVIDRNTVAQSVYIVDLDPRYGYDRVRFDITYDSQPWKMSVDIGDAQYVNGWSTDVGQPNDTAEIQVIDDTLFLYGNRQMPDPLLGVQEWAVVEGETLSIEISDGRVAVNGPGGIDVWESAALFNLGAEANDQRFYAAFNRSVKSGPYGSGVGTVLVTLYPAR